MNSKFWAGNGPDDHQAVIPVRITPAGFFRKIAPPISDVNYACVTSSCVCVEHEDISIDDSSDFQFFFYPENPTPLGWTRGIFQFAVKCRDVSAVESPRWDLIGLSSRWCGGGGGVNAVELQSESCCRFIRLCLPVRQMKVMLWCYL